MSSRANGFDARANAFAGTRGNARGGAVFPTVCGFRSTTWQGNDGTGKSLWRRSTGLVGQWAWNGGIPSFFPFGGRTFNVATDPQGNTYACGLRNNNWSADAQNTAGAGTMACVWKLDSAGNVVWSYDAGDTSGIVRMVRAGNHLFVGVPVSPNELQKVFLNGSVAWTVNVSSPDIRGVDTAGNAYLGTGSSALGKYASSDGSLAWQWYGTAAVRVVGIGPNLYVFGFRRDTWPDVADEPTGTVSKTADTWVLDSAGNLLEDAYQGRATNTVVNAVAAGNGRVYVAHTGRVQAYATSNLNTPVWEWLNSATAIAFAGDRIFVSGQRNNTWPANAAGDPGGGVNRSWWALDLDGTVIASYDTGQSTDGTAA